MKRLKLNASIREKTGGNSAKQLRLTGEVPAIVYGKSGNKPLTVSMVELRALLRKSSSSAAIVEIIEGSNKTLSIIQEVQRNPCSNLVAHVDFYEISENKAIQVTVPVHLEGESYGVKNEGGVLDFTTHNVDIRCIPKDLPEFITIDVSSLKTGDSIHIKDLPKIENATYTQNENISIVACLSPTVTTDDDDEGEEEEAPEETQITEGQEKDTDQ